jgi:hypothetical protein
VGDRVVVTKPYAGDSYGGNGEHTAVCWKDGCYIGEVIAGRSSGIRVDREGVPVAWASRGGIARAAIRRGRRG